jgi:hypothetical protein
VFIDTFGQHAVRINSLLVPLTIIASITTVITAAGMWITEAPNRGWFAAAAVFLVFAALLHPVYFMKANETLAAARIAPEHIAEYLSSWRNWQWLRVGLCFAALVSSIRGLRAADLTTITARSARRVGAKIGTPEAAPPRVRSLR